MEKVLGITYTRDFSYLQNFNKRFLLIEMKVLIITGKTCVRHPPKGPVTIGIIGQGACMQIMMLMLGISASVLGSLLRTCDVIAFLYASRGPRKQNGARGSLLKFLNFSCRLDDLL